MIASREKRVIKALYDEQTIRVYHGIPDEMAVDNVDKLRFANYALNRSSRRMVWLKPSFLWAMYCCRWGEKRGQGRVLAVDIKREGFDRIVSEAVPTVFVEGQFSGLEDWKRRYAAAAAHSQWDIARDILGRPTSELAIQIGIRDELLQLYCGEWMVKLTDVTETVRHMRGLLNQGQSISDLLPKENRYPL
jgi:hypothetical protein